MTLVQVRGLRVVAPTRPLVEEVDVDIDEGEMLGLIGASGSGKSTLAWALARMPPRRGQVSARQLEVAGLDVLGLDREGLRRYRRRDIAIVPQDPHRALNPTSRIGAQVAGALQTGTPRASAIACLAAIGFSDPRLIARRLPHEISGGQAQRVALAIALARRPRLLVLDEPTSSLDEDARRDVFQAVHALREQCGTATVLISHDPDTVAVHCDRVAVLDDARIVEERRTNRGTSDLHRHASSALASLRTSASDGGGGVRLADTLVEVSGLGVERAGRRILEDISLRIAPGEIVGLTGESGSGKTTLARAIAGLIPHDGDVVIRAAQYPPPVQMVWQSPAASLNPRRTVRQMLRRSVRLREGERTVRDLLDMVGLGVDVEHRMPLELSGGQQQRVAVARAFAGRTALVLCDEPTSSLDPHARDAVLAAVRSLSAQTGTACVLISHDLGILRTVSDRMILLRGGRLMDVVSTRSSGA